MDSQAQANDGSTSITPTTVGSGSVTTTASPYSDGNDQAWIDKYNGLQGAFKDARTKYQQEIEGLKAVKTDYETRLSQLQTALQTNETQLQELPTVKQALTEKEQALADATARLDRQNLLLKHRVYDDALTKLVLNSQLPLEELETTLAAVTQATTAQQQAAIAKAAEGSVASSNPPNSASGQDEINALQEKMDTAMREGRYDGPNGFWALNTQLAQLAEKLK